MFCEFFYLHFAPPRNTLGCAWLFERLFPLVFAYVRFFEHLFSGSPERSPPSLAQTLLVLPSWLFPSQCSFGAHSLASSPPKQPLLLHFFCLFPAHLLGSIGFVQEFFLSVFTSRLKPTQLRMFLAVLGCLGGRWSSVVSFRFEAKFVPEVALLFLIMSPVYSNQISPLFSSHFVAITPPQIWHPFKKELGRRPRLFFGLFGNLCHFHREPPVVNKGLLGGGVKWTVGSPT